MTEHLSESGDDIGDGDELYVVSIDESIGEEESEDSTLDDVLAADIPDVYKSVESEDIMNKISQHIPGLINIEKTVAQLRWVQIHAADFINLPLYVKGGRKVRRLAR